MTTEYQIEAVDLFGVIHKLPCRYTGPDARARARAAVRFLMVESTRPGFVSSGGGFTAKLCRVVPA